MNWLDLLTEYSEYSEYLMNLLKILLGLVLAYITYKTVRINYETAGLRFEQTKIENENKKKQEQKKTQPSKGKNDVPVIVFIPSKKLCNSMKYKEFYQNSTSEISKQQIQDITLSPVHELEQFSNIANKLNEITETEIIIHFVGFLTSEKGVWLLSDEENSSENKAYTLETISNPLAVIDNRRKTIKALLINGFLEKSDIKNSSLLLCKTLVIGFYYTTKDNGIDSSKGISLFNDYTKRFYNYLHQDDIASKSCLVSIPHRMAFEDIKKEYNDISFKSTLFFFNLRNIVDFFDIQNISLKIACNYTKRNKDNFIKSLKMINSLGVILERISSEEMICLHIEVIGSSHPKGTVDSIRKSYNDNLEDCIPIVRICGKNANGTTNRYCFEPALMPIKYYEKQESFKNLGSTLLEYISVVSNLNNINNYSHVVYIFATNDKIVNEAKDILNSNFFVELKSRILPTKFKRGFQENILNETINYSSKDIIILVESAISENWQHYLQENNFKIIPFSLNDIKEKKVVFVDFLEDNTPLIKKTSNNKPKIFLQFIGQENEE